MVVEVTDTSGRDGGGRRVVVHVEMVVEVADMSGRDGGEPVVLVVRWWWWW
jgi:hypothetical protein